MVADKLWEVLHKAQTVLKGGWGDPIPLPAPALRSMGTAAPLAEGAASLLSRYSGRGSGAAAPRVLAVTGEELLSLEEAGYFGKWLEALGLKYEEAVFFLTAPQTPEDRDILPSLSQALGVKVVFTLGEPAAQKVLNKRISLPILRGQDYQVGTMSVLPTYHPRQVLEDQNLKKPVWEDLKRLKGIITYA